MLRMNEKTETWEIYSLKIEILEMRNTESKIEIGWNNSAIKIMEEPQI